MKIGAREIGPEAPVFIIAEIGSNHGGSLDRALALIDAAKGAGADAVKFQYFRVDRFLIPRPDPVSLRKYELPTDWLYPLRARCREWGIEFLCTAFDLDSLATIDPFVNAHKIGSWEAENFEYVEQVLDLGKPTITSLGKFRGIPIMPPWRDEQTVFLECVSAYPAPIAGYIDDGLVDPWGVSDHTAHPTIVPDAAVALGACVVEKHMRLGSSIVEHDDPDFPVSITAGAFKMMVWNIRATESAVRG